MGDKSPPAFSEKPRGLRVRRNAGLRHRRIRRDDRTTETFRVDETRLPYAARDLSGCTAVLYWSHRSTPQSDEFAFIAGGYDGTNYRDGFFRFYSR